MGREELAMYFSEQAQLNKDINALWEVGKRSKAKEKRFKEVTLIIQGLDDELTLKTARKYIKAYQEVLRKYNLLDELRKIVDSKEVCVNVSNSN